MTEKQTISADALEFREITRDALPATKHALRTKEAVHPFRHAEELDTNRLAPTSDAGTSYDKHCFGLFAPGRDVPEVAVYVKLLHLTPDEKGHIPSSALPGDIRAILDMPGKPVESPNVAIFYTITNPAFNPDGTLDPSHPVKVGRSATGHTAGEHLIRCVASHLSAQGITCFSTLSPVRKGTGPQANGFAQWLDASLASHRNGETPLLTSLESQRLADLDTDPAIALRLMQDHPEWLSDAQKQFVTQLMKDLTMTYLAEAKSPQRQRIARDPVAHFHLSNGAEIAQIHLKHAHETTESEMQGAHGVMVNYRYDPSQIEQRKAAYDSEGKIAIDPDLNKTHEERMRNFSTPDTRLEGTIRSERLERSAPTPPLP